MEKFYLETDEEFFSIIDRIKRSRDSRITLIVPSGLVSLRSIINLRILKEESISLRKDILIVTADSLIRKLAQQVNLIVSDKVVEDSTYEEKEEKRQVEFERKLGSRKRVISDIIVKRPKIQRETEESKTVKTRIEEPEVESVKPKAREEFRDLGDKEEQFDEFFTKKKKEKEYEPEKESEIYLPKEKKSFKFFSFKKLIFILVFLILVGGGLFAYFILPKAQITISPKKEDINFESEILADKNINSVNLENNSIPAQVFQIEDTNSKTFPSTGEKDVVEKAKGKVTIYNQYSSSEQTLVKTTRLRSESGKIFRLIDTVVIPGATIDEGKIVPSSKELYVEADEAGDAYNIAPTKFTIPGFEGTPKYVAFYGTSTEAMTGGAKGKMKVATKQDIDGATEIVSLELKNKVKDEFDKKIPKELKMLDNSQVLEITESTSSLKPDQPGTSFTINIKAKIWGLAIKEDDVVSVVKEIIKGKISGDKFLLVPTIKLSYGKAQTDSAQGKATFSCSVEAQTAWNIDGNKIKDELAGKDETEVRSYLSSLAEIDTAKVIFWPFWVKRIPLNKNKINVIIEGK